MDSNEWRGKPKQIAAVQRGQRGRKGKKKSEKCGNYVFVEIKVRKRSESRDEQRCHCNEGSYPRHNPRGSCFPFCLFPLTAIGNGLLYGTCWREKGMMKV